jgi:hypothetical protein
LSISAFGTTPPVGLAGLLMINRRVRGVICASTSSALKAKPVSSSSRMGTAVAPVKLITDS